MGFFDSLTGKSTKKAVTNAAGANATGIGEAAQTLTAGKQEALGYNRQGLELSFPAVQAGYDQARGDITGQTQIAHQALNAGGTNARRDISSGFNSARGATENAMQRIQANYDPYLEAGNQAQSIYGDFLGYNGADAAKTAASNFAGNDPSRAFREEQASKRIAAQQNQSGFIGSGRAELANSRAQNEIQYADYQAYLNRLAGQSQQGQQATGQLGQFQMQGAGQIGQAYGQEAQMNAANEQRHAESLKNLYTQNQLGTGQLAIGQGKDTANLYGNYATNNQNIAQKDTTQQAQLKLEEGQNIAKMYMGQDAANQQGMNNMIKIGGMVVSAATGMPVGMGGGMGGGSGGGSAGQNAFAYGQNALGAGYFNPGQSWVNPDTGRRIA